MSNKKVKQKLSKKPTLDAQVSWVGERSPQGNLHYRVRFRASRSLAALSKLMQTLGAAYRESANRLRIARKKAGPGRRKRLTWRLEYQTRLRGEFAFVGVLVADQLTKNNVEIELAGPGEEHRDCLHPLATHLASQTWISEIDYLGREKKPLIEAARSDVAVMSSPEQMAEAPRKEFGNKQTDLRRQRILQLHLAGFVSYKDITDQYLKVHREAVSHDTVNNDLNWLRNNGHLAKKQRRSAVKRQPKEN